MIDVIRVGVIGVIGVIDVIDVSTVFMLLRIWGIFRICLSFDHCDLRDWCDYMIIVIGVIRKREFS